MAGRLAGKVAIVTGGGTGIGRATAIMMAREGAKVVVSNRSPEKGEEVAQEIRDAGGDAIAFAADVLSEEEIRALVEKTVATYGRVDIAFNNAGISGATGPTGEYDSGDWNEVLAINLTGTFLCMKYELAEMVKQGAGAIVNCSSILGQVGFPNSAAYVASKHAVLGLTKSAALEYARQGIRVNAVCPGFIDTDMIDQPGSGDEPSFKTTLAELEPVGRVGTPEEVAEAVIYLASDGAGFTTGTSLLVDGGWVAQ